MFLFLYAGVQCTISHRGTFDCGPCPDGTIGDGVSCVEKPDACASGPCYPAVDCFPIGDRDFVCGPCPSGMTGNGKSCRQLSAADVCQVSSS
jgi:hypothetical protein